MQNNTKRHLCCKTRAQFKDINETSRVIGNIYDV